MCHKKSRSTRVKGGPDRSYTIVNEIIIISLESDQKQWYNAGKRTQHRATSREEIPREYVQ